MDRPADDLTARARIRDAALRLFSERGIEGASIRDIAAAAGVSSGLIRHHFGSKEALREACDRYAIDRMAELRKSLVTEGGMADEAAVAATPPVAIPLQSYLVRSMTDGSATSAALFDEMVELAEQWALRYQVKTGRSAAPTRRSWSRCRWVSSYCGTRCRHPSARTSPTRPGGPG